MNAASIRRLYPDLSGTERFRLAAQADARGDAAERDHLIATCPKVLVSIRDPEFGAAVTGAIELAEALLRSSAPFMAWLDLLGSMQRHVEGRSAHRSLPRNFPRSSCRRPGIGRRGCSGPCRTPSPGSAPRGRA